MSDVTKKVDRGIPVNQRTQVFSDTDAGTGDVILVKESLGKSAKHISITATDDLSVRFNVYRTVVPLRTTANDLSSWAPGLSNVAIASQIQSDSNALIALTAGDSLELDDDLSVDDIEIVGASGVFEILLM